MPEKILYDNLDYEYLKKSFLRTGGEGIDNKGRIKLCNLVAEKNPKKILDVAAGTCVNYELLKKYKYYACDYSKQIIKAAIELYPELKKKIEYQDIRKLEYKDKEFDIVIARHIFEHISEHELAIKECLRIAKRYCYLIFYIPPGENENINFIKDDRGNYYENTYGEQRILGFFQPYKVKKYLERHNERFIDCIYEIEK